ncbi:prenyltransferase/squalene oxidase repeat-containing protein, partial [Actinomadura harenae]
MDRTWCRKRQKFGVLAAAAGTAFSVAVPGLAGTASAAGPPVTRAAPPASARAEASAARANARWLARQLGADGTLRNPNGGTLPDHGLMIDTLFALRAAGEGRLADPIAAYLDDGKHATDYYTWDGLVPNQGYDAVITGGAAAKVLVAAEASGRDPRRFGGHDMVAEVQGAIMRTGPDKGRVSDYSKNPDLSSSVYNNSNMFGQALGVIGLAGAGENDRLAIDALLSQQCSDGYFRIFFDHTSDNTRLSTCDEDKASGKSAPDGDATAMSLSALLAARKAGATGLDGPIGRTVAWLKGRQAAGGGWGGGVSTEAPNTNSTGLVVQALADAGDAKDAVDRGTAYLRSAQVTSADAGNRLADQVGAIAYTPEQYQSARDSGITGTDTWVRAGAQASLGLSQVGFYDLAKGKVPGGGDGGDPGDGDGPGGTPPPGGGGDGNQPSRPGGQLPLPKPRPGASPPSVAPPSGRHGSPAPPPGGGNGGGDKRTANPQNNPVVTPKQTQAQAALPDPAGRLGSYLAGKLVDGDHIEVTEGGRTYVDYDATADVVFALRSLGEQPVAVTRASRFLLTPESVKAYAYGVPYEKSAAAYAEPLAKLQLIARFLQFEPAAPADLATTVAGLRDGLARLRTPQGRFEDTGSFGSADTSVRRQAWAILATTAGASPGDAAVPLRVLLGSQCTDGAFPAVLGAATCATGDVTATAAAIAALNAGPRGGVDGVGDASAVQVAARL